VTVVLGAAVISTFLLRLVWMAVHSPGWDLSYLAYAVRHPWITSYYTDAAGLVNFPGWLENFDQVLGVLSVHSRNKPPGPISAVLCVHQRAGGFPADGNCGGRCAGRVAIFVGRRDVVSVAGVEPG
jgi:hypothetical protein